MRALGELHERGKMRKKKRDVWENLKLLRHKNLAKEVHIYGYHFSWKVQFLLMVATLTGIGTVGLLFKLSVFWLTVVILAAIVMLPVLILNMYKKMYEQKRFADAAAYMEQMLYSFLKTGKIISSLRESCALFEAGMMRSAIQAAVEHIEQGKTRSDQGILREGFQLIERNYNCRKMQMVHDLLLNAEEYGGEVESSVIILLEDLESWKKRGYRLQADKKKSHTDNVVSIVVATMMCAAALYVLDAMKTMFAAESSIVIFRIGTIQISSAFFILFLYHVFSKSSKSLTADWLTEENFRDSAYIKQCYDTVFRYDKRNAYKKGLLCSIPFMVLVGFCFSKRHWIPGAIALTFGLFVLFSKRIGYRLAKKDITQEMHLALPQWLMEMALLLQNNNVEIAIQKSRAGAPAALQSEIDALLERSGRMPGELCVYTDFCREYDLPEVAGCMKMMHAISETGSGDVRIQMAHFIQRVNEMQSIADQIRNESIALRMKMIFAYPVIAATAKLLVDLTVGMAVMFRLLGSMSG